MRSGAEVSAVVGPGRDWGGVGGLLTGPARTSVSGCAIAEAYSRGGC